MVLPLGLDVTDRAARAQVVDSAEAGLGDVRVLCNNAGISALGVNVDSMSAVFWDQVININLNGVFNGTNCLVGRMKARGRGGHIVNTASVAALGLVSPGSAAYAASKCAVLGFSEVLRQELALFGIGVTALCPGPVKSQLWRTSRRLRGLPELDAPPPESLRGSAAPDALDPLLVGRWVLDAIRDNTFLLITHPEFRSKIAERNALLMRASDTAASSRRQR